MTKQATHDLDAPAGTTCPGCPPHDQERPLLPYLILAARNSAGAGICGHWHAEHVAETREEAETLIAALAARHASVELYRREPRPDGQTVRYTSSRYTTERPTSAACCRPIPAPEHFDFRSAANPAGACCPFCGDLMAAWTHQ